MKKPHKHAALIKAWADGAEIEYLYKREEKWVLTENPVWSIDVDYRIKPEISYPKTNYSELDIYYIFKDHKGGFNESLFAVANAAIKRAIDDGQVILPCKDMK